MLKSFAYNSLVKLNHFIKPLNFQIFRLPKKRPYYYSDGLFTIHDPSFMRNSSFISSYERGLKASGYDHRWYWRVHTGLWVAKTVAHLEGDFVECGVNRGFLSSAIMHHLKWNTLNKSFYLFDTFCGLDHSQLSEKEKFERKNNGYVECYEEVKKNFSEFKNVTLVRGIVPNSLYKVDIEKISYLSIDMNCAEPEIAAAKFFWPKLVKGGMILLDDYCFCGFTSQRIAFDQFANEYDISILSLPTGQGLIVKL